MKLYRKPNNFWAENVESKVCYFTGSELTRKLLFRLTENHFSISQWLTETYYVYPYIQF